MKLSERAYRMNSRVKGRVIFIIFFYMDIMNLLVRCQANKLWNVFRADPKCEIICPTLYVYQIRLAIGKQLIDRWLVLRLSHFLQSPLLTSSKRGHFSDSLSSLLAATATGSTPNMAKQSRVAQPSGVPR